MRAIRRKFDTKAFLILSNAANVVRLLLIPVIVVLYLKSKNSLCVLAVALSVAMGAASDAVLKNAPSEKFGIIFFRAADKLTLAALAVCLTSRSLWFWALLGLLAVNEAVLALWKHLTVRLTDMPPCSKRYDLPGAAVFYAFVLVLLLFPSISRAAAAVLVGICVIVTAFSLVFYRHYYQKILTKEVIGDNRKKIMLWIWRCVLALIWAAIIAALFIHKKDFTVEDILSLTPSNPILAAFTLLALFALKSVSVVLYSGILYAVSGVLFPLPAAIFVNILGTAVMVSIPYFIGEKLGGSAVERIAERYPKAERLREIRRGRNDFFFVLFVRLIGILPSDIVSAYMGAIRVKYLKYLAGCLLGMLPPAVIFPLMGMGAKDIHSPMFFIAIGAELAFMALSAVIYQIYRNKSGKK